MTRYSVITRDSTGTAAVVAENLTRARAVGIAMDFQEDLGRYGILHDYYIVPVPWVEEAEYHLAPFEEEVGRCSWCNQGAALARYRASFDAETARRLRVQQGMEQPT